MKVCGRCGTMISPHPMHKQETGTCDECLKELGIHDPYFLNNEGINGDRPKIKGKHMVIKKSQAQLAMEKRKRELGSRYY